MHAEHLLCLCMPTKFVVDSSGRFPFRVQTNRQTPLITILITILMTERFHRCKYWQCMPWSHQHSVSQYKQHSHQAMITTINHKKGWKLESPHGASTDHISNIASQLCFWMWHLTYLQFAIHVCFSTMAGYSGSEIVVSLYDWLWSWPWHSKLT